MKSSVTARPSVTPRGVRARRLTRSLAYLERARRVIPSCTQTLSKGPTQFVQGAAPVFLRRGLGSHVWDVDGNEYLDYAMALGPIILGYNDPMVTAAVKRQLRDGTTFSLPHPLEVEVAELLVEMIPCAEMVRFSKNGADATSAAVRVARAYTGRALIASCGFHGWQDWSIGTTTRHQGVPDAVRSLTAPFPYNDLESLRRIFAEHTGKVAAVIMEPVGVVEPLPGFLQGVQELTRREGAVLIFDEVLTGFRLALGGAQEYYGVTPDLACVSKAIANGYPLSAVVGRREIMEVFDTVFVSMTFAGDAIALAAAKATLTQLRDRRVIEVLWEQGRKLQDGYNALGREFRVQPVTECIGLAPRTAITFKDDAGAESLVFKSLFQQECLMRGILFTGAHNVCYRHSDEDLAQTLAIYRQVFEIFSEALQAGDALQRLVGPPIQPVFRAP